MAVTTKRAAGLPLQQRARDSAVFAACIVALAALAIGLYVMFLRGVPAPDTGLRIPLLLLGAAFCVANRLTVTEQIGDSMQVLSALEVPLIAAMFTTRPVAAIAACAVGTVVSRLFLRHQPRMRFLFGFALNLLEVVGAMIMFRAIVHDAFVLRTSTWAAALVTVLAIRLGRTVIVPVVVRASGATVEARQVIGWTLLTLGACASVTSLALVAVMVATQSRLAIVLVALVCLIPVLAYRAYVLLRGRYARLRLLQDFTAGLSRSTDLAEIVDSALDRVRRVMRAERADLVLLGGPDAENGRFALGGTSLTVDLPTTGDWLWERVIDDQRSVSCREGTKDPAAATYLSMVRSRDLLAMPLVHGDDVLGALIVRDRTAELPTFGADDRELFVTIAEQTAVAIHAAQLAERVHRDDAARVRVAAHDALTGLPNRASFNLAIDTFSRGLGSDATTSAAVLSLDLNRFKEVNSALGHATGDALIVGVAKRVRDAVPHGATVARLGGDELAVLVPGVSSAEMAVQLAERVQTAVRVDYAIDDLTVSTDAAIGIALLPDHGRDHITLMRRADVAMYIAKEQHEGAVSVFDPGQEMAANRQISLVRDLRVAIENGDLNVHYQPKGELDSGEIVGVEALVRWQHPQLGNVPPDEFIALAEQAGLVQPLTEVVLAQALQQCRAWHDRGLGLHVAVNLSARSLREIRLATRVQNALDEANVPAAWLTLEITEGEFVNDGPIARRSLRELHELGVQLSIDDFGTGYSSLSYLARLTADEVKIDKSFVTNVADDDVNAAIVRAVVELAERLGLRTVAEGCEDQRTWDRLGELGVTLGQGYYLSRAVPADTLSMWLWERRRAGKGLPRTVPTSNIRTLPRR